RGEPPAEGIVTGYPVRITERVELLDEQTLDVLATFPAVHSALLAQTAVRGSFIRIIDGPSCADCDRAPVANTERGLRCEDHLAMDSIYGDRRPPRDAEALDRLLSAVLTYDLDDQIVALLDAEADR